MAVLSFAKPARRRVTAAVVGILAVAGATTLSSAPAHAEISYRCGYYPFQPELTVGSQGDPVKQAQCELNYAYARGHSTNYGLGPYMGLKVDGDFGNNTEAATKNFQQHCMGATNPDGIIGPHTWAALNYWVSNANYC